MQRHKCFISYYHDSDQFYKDKFVRLFDDYYDIFIDGSVGDGDIPDYLSTETIRQKIRDNYLRDTSVTIVLIGPETWKRKYVDWEISSSVRNTQKNPRSGLLGILLPNHPNYGENTFTPNIIPPRLYDNVKCGFAKIYNWTENPNIISSWIDAAFKRKNDVQPDNSRDMFARNRTTDYWED